MTIKLKITEIIDLYNALSSLDGHSKSIKQGENESVITVPYHFSGKLRWNIAKNLGVLKPHIKDYTKVRDDLIKQYSLPEETTINSKTNPIGWKVFSEENDKLGREEIEVNGLLNLDVNELLKDENPVSALTLNALSILLQEPTM